MLPTNPSHLHAFHEPLGDIRGYNPSFDPYCAYIEEMPRKVEWTSFFDYSFDFSMEFDKCKRELTIFAWILLVFSCSHHFEMHVIAYNQFLRALTVSKLVTRILTDMEEWLKLLKPP